MKKAYRIKKNSEIKELINHKKSAGNKYFVIYKKNNHEQTHFRFAVSVSKKFGNAVKRNKAKRRIREIIREQDINKTVDFFIVIKNNSSNLTFQEQKQQLIKLLKKLKIIGD
ncbi:MAG: ribonuclease P protein component [Candidatus Izimaplasma sp.]|nr:ribonuclease P protein component [Candidatus Izimaplasma bacterium]